MKKKLATPKFDSGPINSVIGGEVPGITATPVGEFLLNQALKNKFGAGYRNNAGAKKALDHFSKEKRFFDVYRKLKAK